MTRFRAYRTVLEAFVEEKLAILKLLRARLRRQSALASLRRRRSVRRPWSRSRRGG